MESRKPVPSQRSQEQLARTEDDRTAVCILYFVDQTVQELEGVFSKQFLSGTVDISTDGK